MRVNATAGEIESRAFRLVGESQEAIDREARELFEILLQQSPPLRRSTAFGLAFMLRELVCERIREIIAHMSKHMHLTPNPERQINLA